MPIRSIPKHLFQYLVPHVQLHRTPAFPVDTHIHRLAERWGFSSGKSVEQTEADMKAVFPKETWDKLHLQLIWFGRQHCPAKDHDKSACPVCSWIHKEP